MISIGKAIIAAILTLFLQFGVTDAVDTSPHDAAKDFMDGLTGCDKTVMETYMDNEYVNFLVNVQGDQDLIDRMDKALLGNIQYKITKTASKGSVAVAKIEVTTSDFSKVKENYDEKSYDYIMDNLYDDDIISDKEKLNEKCLEIYIQQIEKAASKDPDLTSTIYLPMTSDGYGGWKVILSDKIMKTLLGGFEIPESDSSLSGGDI